MLLYIINQFRGLPVTSNGGPWLHGYFNTRAPELNRGFKRRRMYSLLTTNNTPLSLSHLFDLIVLIPVLIEDNFMLITASMG